ncbi:MAG: hypothetical protein KatS3mg094_321 [Candidatus Parcubacteria bacterium]|nr:MAG: hypothetical protein KatS3mg094_321 [Candidatus Parcubacteria bacterium]
MNPQEFINSYCYSIQSCLQGLYNLGVALAVMLAFFMFLFGAFKNLLSVVPDVKMEGKSMMRNAIIGLVVIFVSGSILYWINPFIFDPRIVVYRITTNVIKVNFTINNQNLNINGNNFNISLANIDEKVLQDLSQRTCINNPITIRTTQYYTPVLPQEPNKHKFLSDITMQGKGIINTTSGTVSILTPLNAKGILETAKLSGKKLDKCKDGWVFTWVKMEGRGTKNCPKAETSQKESVKHYEGALNVTTTENLIISSSTEINDYIRGAYGPVIPGQTAARDNESTVFKGSVNGEYQAVKIIDCLRKKGGGEYESVSCGIKDNVFIITDTGSGGKIWGKDKWLDLYAGIGKEAIDSFGQKKSDYAKVCIIGNIKLNQK